MRNGDFKLDIAIRGKTDTLIIPDDFYSVGERYGAG